MRAKLQSKRVQASIVIAIAALVVLAGAFAWNSFNQQRINEFHVTNAPNVNLHDDFAGGPEKDVYVENSGSQPVLVRVRLTELLIQAGALLPVDATDDEQGSKWHVHSPQDGGCEVCSFPAHEYFTWMMDGHKFFMPAPPGAKGYTTDDGQYVEPKDVGDLDEIIDYAALLREAFADDATLLGYIDAYLGGDSTNASALQAAIEAIDPGIEIPNVRQYDWQPEEELTRKLNEVSLTLIPTQIITMQDWIAGTTYGEAYKTGNFWVMDADGWCYWASPLLPGNTTGQLLSNVEYEKKGDDDNLIYRINVTLNATTYANTELNAFFQLAITNVGITDEGKLLMLMISGDYVVGDDGELYIDEGGGLYSSYEVGGMIYAGLDGVPGSSDDLAVGDTLTIAGTAYAISGFTMGANGAVYLSVGDGLYLQPVDEEYAFVFAGEDGEIGSEDDGVSADPNYAGGFGTEESPFLIATKAQLEYMRDTINTKANYSQNKHFKQTADIDLENELWTPIGVTSTNVAFKGTYHGDGYKISGLNVQHDNYDTQGCFAGLFGRLNGGRIYNLAVEGSVINTAADGSGNSYTGGIAAIMTSSGGQMDSCVFKGSVKGVNITGGLVGRIDDKSSITNSFVAFDSTVDGGNKQAGGIVGRVHEAIASVNTSYSLAKVTGTTPAYVGGVTGYIASGGTVSNSAFLQTAAINSTLNAFGTNYGTVTNTDPVSDPSAALLNRLNNSGVAWTQDPGGSWPLPAVIRDRSLGAYSDPNYAGGKGTEAEPYLIATKEQLEYMRNRVNAGTDYMGVYFQQTDDIDLNNEAWTPIGRFVSGAPDNVTFKGFYDGGGYSITKLLVNEEALMRGLFGDISDGGISNLSVQGTVEFTKNQINNVGGIVGRATNAYITDCVFSGSVKGYQYVGGIAGAGNNTLIKNCLVTYGSKVANTATANDYGGLVGYLSNNSKLQSSYSLANMSGKYENFAGGGVAGNIGANGGSVIACAFLRTDTGTLNAVGNGGTVTNTGCFSDLNSTLTATNGTTITAANLVALLDAGAEGSGKDWVQDIPGGSWPLPAVIRDRSLGDYTPPPTGDNDSFAGGYGTQASPYLIANKTQLEYLRNQVNENASFAKDKYFKQTAHIDLGGAAWTPIGKITEDEYDEAGYGEDFGIPFSGVYDGGGYKVTGLNIPSGSYSYESAGLFGFIRDATVKNLFVEGEVLRGSYTGGIAGIAVQSDILNCFFSGTVNGGLSAGGIVGTADGWQGTTNIKYCGVAGGGEINGSWIGGIGALLYRTNIYSCYVLADVVWSYGILVDDVRYTTMTQCAYLKTETVNFDAPTVPPTGTGNTYNHIGYFANATNNVTITNSSGAFTGNLLALLNKGGEGQWRAAVGGENDGYPVLTVMK